MVAVSVYMLPALADLGGCPMGATQVLDVMYASVYVHICVYDTVAALWP